MKNKDIENYEKQFRLAEKRLKKSTENVVVPSLEIPDMTRAFNSIIQMNNSFNNIQNSLIPLMEMTDRYNKIINDVSIAYQAVNPIEIFIKT